MVFVALAAALMGQAAQQDNGGSAVVASGPDGSIYRLAVNTEQVEAIAFAECLVTHEARKVEPLLRIAPEADDAADRWRDISSGKCSTASRKRPDIALLRGSIFVTLYRKGFSDGRLAGLPALADEVDLRTNPAATDHVRRMRMIKCGVGRDPANSRSFVINREGSRLREMAHRALMSNLQHCLQGGEYERFRTPNMPGLVAEALYLASLRPPGAGDSSDSKRTGW